MHQHVAGNCLVIFMGIGQDSLQNAWSSLVPDLTQARPAASAGQTCRADFSTNNETDFSTVTQSACPSD